MTDKSSWLRVSKHRPCPVCKKPDWCLYAGDPERPDVALCQRVESAKRCGESGWLHRLRDDGPAWSPARREIRIPMTRPDAIDGGAEIDFTKLAAEFRAAVRPKTLERLATQLGLTAESLVRLGAGWSAEYQGWSFPMTDTASNVLGIRLRCAGGKKLSVRGGKEGLFIPEGLEPGALLLVTEGPTDCAALLDLGFLAVGRPSCTGGVKLIVNLVCQHEPAQVVIVADGDAPGHRGAEKLASVLVAYSPSIRIIVPPAGVKDAREWKRQGVTAAKVLEAIDAATVRRLTRPQCGNERRVRRMETDNGNGFTIECNPTGRNGSVTLTARLAGDVLEVQTLDLTKPKQRNEFVGAVCEGRNGIDREALDSQLKKLAADLASKPEAVPAESPELDISSIVRPERFITPKVSGLAVPTMTIIGDEPVGRWQLYLRWADGKRECRPMPTAIDLPDKRKLWIHPQPAEPTASMMPGWSAAARQAWLKGSPAPDPADLFKLICEQIAYFVDLPQQHAKGTTATLALWTILSYAYMAWPAVPYLFIGGPLGSGKSRVFDILMRLVFRSLSSSNMTAAALFRTLHGQGGTLLLDEAERLKQTQNPDVSETLSMLLAGYRRGGQATRLEPVGDTFKTVCFDVYGPKAMACIAGVPPALASRSITVMMFRAAHDSEKPRRRIDAEPQQWQALRDDLHCLALEYGPTWLELSGRNDVCPRMSGRDFELWQPLLALAAFIESHGAKGLLQLVQDHALTTIDAGRDDVTPDADEALLWTLADAVRNGAWPTPSEILEGAQKVEPAVFKLWHPRTVSARLKCYGIPTTKKVGSRREYRDVTPEMLRRIQANYGIDLGYPEEIAVASA